MIIGHQKQWQFLRKSAEIGRIPHALLFFGQSQLGKKTLALEFIKLLNCQATDFSKKPCQVCSFCQDIKKGQHPDLLIVEPTFKEIQISQIRELSWRLSLKPFSAPIKAAIIDRAHLMNREAQTSLLKTLEEPKGNTILILITEYPEMLFPTILSRVQKLRFLPVLSDEIESYLKNQGSALKESQEISKLCLGRPGVAVDFLSFPAKLEIYNRRVRELTEILNSDLSSRFRYVKEVSKEPQILKEILDSWIVYFRNVLLSKLNGADQKYSFPKLKNILRQIQKTNFLISTTNINQRLALEILMMEL